VPQVEVTFDIDANGILSVSAKDTATQKEQKITITASSGLSKEEVERMVRESEAHQEEDKKRRDLIEARNMGDSMAYQAEKTLSELGEQVPAEIKTEVDEKVSAVREALATEDTDRIKQATNDLSTSLQKIGQAMYAQQQATAGTRGPDVNGTGPTQDGATEPGTEGAEEGTVEGEFREV
jgi:molecular chaperone DnaK